MVTRCVSCHLLCLHVWRTRHVGLIEPHMSDGTVRSITHTHTHTHTHRHICTSLCRKMGGKARECSSALLFNSLQKDCDSSPSPFTCATGATSRLFFWQGNRQSHQMHELEFFKSSSDGETKKGTASARFSHAGTVWNNSVHYACRYWLPNHTNQRPHCVDYLVNLLMPLSSIAGVNVPGFFSSLLLLGRCSVRLVICFKCFLGNETRWNPAKRTLLSWRAFS